MIRKFAFISSLSIILLVAGGCQNKTEPEDTQKSAVSTSSEHESVEQGKERSILHKMKMYRLNMWTRANIRAMNWQLSN